LPNSPIHQLTNSPITPGDSPLALTYALVIVTEAVVISALWLFQRVFA